MKHLQKPNTALGRGYAKPGDDGGRAGQKCWLSEQSIRDRVIFAANLVCFGMPFAAYLGVFTRYSVNMPIFDDYDAVLGWMHQYLSSTTLHQKLILLVQQHYEHRIVFDYLAELLCFYLFHKINFVFLCFIGLLGLFGIVAAMLYTGKRADLSNAELIPVPILLLTLSQSDLIWFSMASLQQYWQLLFDVLSLIALTGPPRKSAFLTGCLLAFAATFSGGGGLLAFPAGLVFLTVSGRWRFALFWAIFAAVVFEIYFRRLNYELTFADHIAHAYAYQNPLAVIAFSVRFLGNFGLSTTDALIFGSVSTIFAVPLFVLCLREKNQTFMYIWMFVFASAFVTALSRSNLGQQESVASRYTIYGLLGVALLYMEIISLLHRNSARRIAAALGIIISFAVYLSWIDPALVRLRQINYRENTGVVTLPFLAEAHDPRAELRTAMNDGIFYPAVLYRHLPKQFEQNHRYDEAWNALFEVYLFRPDIQSAFPLAGAASYKPLLSWAAAISPTADQAYAQLQRFSPAYHSMLAILK